MKKYGITDNDDDDIRDEEIIYNVKKGKWKKGVRIPKRQKRYFEINAEGQPTPLSLKLKIKWKGLKGGKFGEDDDEENYFKVYVSFEQVKPDLNTCDNMFSEKLVVVHAKKKRF